MSADALACVIVGLGILAAAIAVGVALWFTR